MNSIVIRCCHKGIIIKCNIRMGIIKCIIYSMGRIIKYCRMKIKVTKIMQVIWNNNNRVRIIKKDHLLGDRNNKDSRR